MDKNDFLNEIYHAILRASTQFQDILSRDIPVFVDSFHLPKEGDIAFTPPPLLKNYLSAQRYVFCPFQNFRNSALYFCI